ncbi:MAG: hypothetical protein H8E81_10510 [Deltaproteobacteria bacterium]|nr:hypothetical protein [Deltaproteobacteria bacterium]
MVRVKKMNIVWIWLKGMSFRGTAVLICCLSFTSTAFAHRVMIFGWVEGDRVKTQSKFSSNRVVKAGDVSVFDAKENRLLTGKTDEQGEFSFQIPEKKRMKIVLSTATGHRAEWVISKAELESGAQRRDHSQNRQQRHQNGEPVMGNCQHEEMETIIEEALDEKLRPLLQFIAESKERPVSLQDILGGFGYVIGLVGLVAYLRFRGNEKQGS